MLKTLNQNMLGLDHPFKVIAPLAAKYGFRAIYATRQMLEDRALAREAAAIIADSGLSWGMMPLPANFCHWELDDGDFRRALEILRRWADAARVLGISRAADILWPCSTREFDDNFQWTLNRIRAVNDILRENGIAYGLEFLGSHELRRLAEHEFVHSLSGALALAKAAGSGVGIVFDVFQWYTSQDGAMDDVLLMEQEIERLVAVHVSDGMLGRSFDQQRDIERRLPGVTGVIDSKAVLARFRSHPCSALYMVEPFDIWRAKLGAMEAEEAVRAVSEALARVE